MAHVSVIPHDEAADALAQGGGIVALLDAGRVPGLVERLETGASPYLCLFQGDAAETLADTAPWLVALRPGDPLLRRFLDDRALDWALWDKGAGILLRTNLPLEALRRHLRRFLRIELEDGVFFFRFWQPDMARTYFAGLGPARLSRWMFPREGGRIDALLIPDPEAGALIVASSPAAPHDTADPGRDPRRGALSLSRDELALLHQARQQQDLARMTALMAATFPERAGSLAPHTLDRALRRSVARAAEFGIRQSDHAFRLAAWDLHADGAFEREDPEGELRAILEAGFPETDKMRRLSERRALLHDRAGTAGAG